ncbi:glyoxalase-like domain-containing protein [Cerioporus squamosus]|nr:glyoxalase-like domain-containing protein [Cerioporus squamosus]
MTGPSTKILDHIPHLTPPGTLQESAEAFRKLGFTVIPGGTHAGGATANALVVFADGTYLELIHFVRPPEPDDPNPWARKQPGWIDYAFLGTGGKPSIADAINARAKREGTGSVVHYEESKGGRRREDGKVLEWVISSTGEELRGALPFFCGDVTPRDWRVPLEPRSNTEHTNTTLGVSYIKLLVASNRFDASKKQLITVLGAQPGTSTNVLASWDLDEQPAHLGVHKAAPQLVLVAAGVVEERAYVQEHGQGIYEVGFLVSDASKAGSARTPFGRAVWQTSGGGH